MPISYGFVAMAPREKGARAELRKAFTGTGLREAKELEPLLFWRKCCDVQKKPLQTANI
jgi:hypothetical protein